MNKRQHILASLFSFFMAFFLFLGILVGMSQVTIFSQKYLMNTLEECHYYQGIADALNTDFMQGAGAAGFESQIFENFVTVEDIQSVSENYINEYFQKDIAEVSTKQFQEKMNTYLHEVAKEANMKLTKDDEKRLQEYIVINVEGYKQYLSFPFLQYFIMAFDMMEKVLPFVFVACLVMSAGAFYFFTRLKCHQDMKILYESSVLFGSGLMLILPAMFIFVGQYIKRISLTPEFYYRFFVEYIEGYFMMVLLCGGAFVILGLIRIFIYQKRKIKSQ